VLFGATLGLIAGYFGGRVDAGVRAAIDVLLTVPEMVLAIAIAAALGAGAGGTIAAIVVSFTPRVARLVRARTMEVRAEAFVDAALTLGFRHRRVALRHVLPNVATVIVIEASLLAGQAVLVAAALGFLGLGVPPPAPEWGAMLGAGRDYIDVAPHLVVGPGIAISVLIFSFNMLGDGLRDRLDPRTRV
jgi:ABC-type dipeptide/oligopeptide/nickel transport system permease subunit